MQLNILYLCSLLRAQGGCPSQVKWKKQKFFCVKRRQARDEVTFTRKRNVKKVMGIL